MKKGIGPCLFAVGIDAMGFGLVYPMMTVILTSTVHPMVPQEASIFLRHFLLGLGFLLYPFGMFFGASFMGDLSDILGRKKVLLLCMSGVGVSFLLMGIGSEFLSLFFLMLGRLLSGLMAGNQPIAQAAISDLSSKETRASYMSMMTLALSVGNAFGPLLGGFFSDSKIFPLFSYSTPFYLAGILALSCVVWLGFRFKETMVERSKKRLNFMRPIHIFLEAFKHREVRFLSLTFLLMQVGFGLYFQMAPVLLHQRWNYGSAQLGMFNGLIGISFAIALLVGMRWALSRWKIETITVATLFLTGIFQCMAGLFPKEVAMWIFAVPVALFDCLAYTGMLTAFSKAVDARSQGWAMGVSGSVMALSWVIAGLATNLISSIGLPGLIFFGGLLIVISGGCMQRYVRRYTVVS